MKLMWKRLAALVIAWPVINHPWGFSVPKPRPAGPPELEAAKQAVEATVTDPIIEAKISAVVNNLMGILGNFQKVTDWVNSLNSAGKAWREWESATLKSYGYGGNIDDHTSSLMEKINATTQPGSNIILAARNPQVPSEPVRGTYLERLMLGVLLCDKACGMSAIFAESGSGKSVAVLLAVTEVARAKPEDLFVVFRDDLDTNLKSLFRVDDLGFTAPVAEGLFIALAKRKKTLHLIFDNVRDAGVLGGDETVLIGLARAAYEHGHQIVFTTQFQEAAESIATLNGDATFIADLQDTSYGACRWSTNETIELIRSLDGDDRIDEILEASRIPDWRGRWRPRPTKAFMKRGQRPSAALKRAGSRVLSHS